jgi:hypothetical protein
MLIEFTVKNYRSIKEAQTISMMKAKGTELEESNTFLPDSKGAQQLLRSAAIYGANGSGKSNLIKALNVMESIVLSSQSMNKGDTFPVTPFLFDDESVNEPTEFEVIFISNNVRFQYGFVVSSTQVFEEWLIAYPKGKPQRWFSRIYDKENNCSEYKFVESFTGKKSVWKDATRENALFLSTAVQLNSKLLKPVYDWFLTKLRPNLLGEIATGYTAGLCLEKDQRKKIVDFLKAADFDIFDIDVSAEKFDPSLLPENLPQPFRDELIDRMKDQDIIDVKTVHKTKSGNLVKLDLDEESDGTRRFFTFIGPWLDTLESGYILIIDEIHDNLHPRLVRHLVDLFNSKKTNPNNAQLIFSTHETSILSQEVLRRDQIWFCEKDSDQATNLYSLTEFKPLKGRENIEDGYLSGRYGAYPFITTDYC